MQEYPFTPTEKTDGSPLAHYYGGVVRGCFLAAGFLLLLANLFDQQFLGFYLVVGVIGVLVIVILAGLTSPKKKNVLFLEANIAGIAFLVFEYFAIAEYQYSNTIIDLVFILRQALAMIFLTTLYYSVKNIRWARQQDEKSGI